MVLIKRLYQLCQQIRITQDAFTVVRAGQQAHKHRDKGLLGARRPSMDGNDPRFEIVEAGPI